MAIADRRQRSEARLGAQGIELSAEGAGPKLRADAVGPLPLPSVEQTLCRALCFAALGLYGEGLERDLVLQHAERWNLWRHFTSEEASFLQELDPPWDKLAPQSYLHESCFALLWTLGLIDSLDEIHQERGLGYINQLLLSPSMQALCSGAKYRPVEQLLDEEDYYLVYEAAYRASFPPRNGWVKLRWMGELSPVAVRYRLKALTWLLGRIDED